MSHLNYETRRLIEQALKKGLSAREIGKITQKHYTGIPREIQRHRQKHEKGNHTRLLNNCVHRFQCKVSDLCADVPTGCCQRCDRCRIRSCNERCLRFQLEICPALQKFPCVCNGCNTIQRCMLQKYFYRAEIAQKRYEEELPQSRTGFNPVREDIDLISRFFPGKR